MANDLYLGRVKTDVQKVIDQSKEIEAIEHKGLRGGYRETVIGEIIKKYISPHWDVGDGQVIDSLGNASNETDLIIFNMYEIPPVLFSGNSGAFPIETCAYTVNLCYPWTTAAL